MRKVIFGVLFTLYFFIVALTFVFYDFSIVNPWLVAGPAVIVALATAYPVGRALRSLTDIRHVWLNAVLYVVAFVIFASCAILGLNYILADTGSFPYENAVAERVYTKTRHKTVRTGRRSYSSGPPYKVYFLDLRLPDGRLKDIEVKHAVYKDVSKGDTVKIRVGKGPLRITVIDPSSIKYKAKPKSKRRYPPHRLRRHKSLKDSASSRTTAFY